MNGYIRITNGTEKAIKGRYDGVDYVFKPGVALDVPHVVAAHVFGFGHADKSKWLHNLGWLQSSEQYEDALKKLGQVKFEDVVMVARTLEEDEDEENTKDLVPSNGLGNAGPPVNAEGEPAAGPAPAAEEPGESREDVF